MVSRFLSCSAEFNLNQLLDEFNSELPDELGTLGASSDSAQNGTKVETTTAVHPDNTTQKHQQLSQLLSSTTPNSSPQQNQVQPGPSHSPNIAGGLSNNINSLNNAVKSPLSNSLASPGNVVSKGPNTSLPHSLGNDLLTSTAYSNIVSSAATSSPMVGAMSMANTLNKPLTSQALMGTGGSVGIHQNQLMNGPQMRMNSSAGAASTSTLSSLPGALANSNLGNSLAAGQLQNPQGLNHPGLNSQPILQVRMQTFGVLPFSKGQCHHRVACAQLDVQETLSDETFVER